MADTPLLKDRLNAQAIEHIANAFAKAMPGFDAATFRQQALHGLCEMALKQRVQHIIAVLHPLLPEDFADTAGILLQVRHCWHNASPDAGWSAFAAWPVIDYVAVYGLEYPDLSLPLLKELTPLFSAEFAIRPFLLRHFAITYNYLQAWCSDDDEHVRRLVSEGSRPRLPWGIRLQPLCDNPAPLLPLLTRLNADPSLYVRKSVANSLNDIGKDHPDIVISTCSAWQINASAGTHWIIRHGTRSLVKAGHPATLRLLGFSQAPAVNVSHVSVANRHLHLGDELSFSIKLQSLGHDQQQLVVDYAIHYVKANGSTSAKVFKLKSFTLQTGQHITLAKRHSLRPITTRRYHEGWHRLEILLNGAPVGTSDFFLTV